jgi:predicted nucleic acid-binding protein
MGQGYLIDSNVIIDFLATRLSEKGSTFVEQIFSKDFLISVIVKIEVLGYLDIPPKMDALEEFLNSTTIFPLNEEVTNQTIVLRKTYKKLRLGDSIIAATALVHDLSLITRNTKDFNQIDGLRLINPYEI